MSFPWAMITGASAGIGWATAKALAKAQHNLILVARRQERLEALAKEIQSTSKTECKVVCLDVTEASAVDAFFQKESGLLEKVEVLVNNAGLAKGTDKFQDSKLSDWETMIDTNIKGLLYFSRGMLPLMIKKNSGHIINIGSVAGRWIYPGGAVYCASKFAVRALSEGMRMDLIGTALRVSNVEPGMVETEFSKVRFEDEKKAQAVYKGMQPLRPEDIADCVVWCLQRPAHVNIQELVVFPVDQPAVGQVHRN